MRFLWIKHISTAELKKYKKNNSKHAIYRNERKEKKIKLKKKDINNLRSRLNNSEHYSMKMGH